MATSRGGSTAGLDMCRNTETIMEVRLDYLSWLGCMPFIALNCQITLPPCLILSQ